MAGGRLDELVFGQLEKLGIEPANLCSDTVFLRRVYLDITGTLPTPSEARDFLASQEKNKRKDLVETLLAREEFADYWTMKWCDLLRVKSEFPINLWPNAVQAYHRWIYTSIKENKPYDQFAREILTASGSNFRVPQVNFYRAMQRKGSAGITEMVALTFMGTRAASWPNEKVTAMEAFFSCVGYKPTAEWKEEIVYFDREKLSEPRQAGFPDGKVAQLTSEQDPREEFAKWLIDPKNPWFAKTLVNRIWFWLMGRGIVHEPDDMREENPPTNPALLAFLEQEFVASGYDLKQLMRLILNSQVYQLSSIPRSVKPEAAIHFAHFPLRQLEAEVLIDALNEISGTNEKYTSPIPEPFTFIPEDQRAIALADGSISSSFLEMFGRSARDTGLLRERNDKPSAAQRLHLLNSSHIQRKIEQSPRLQMLALSQKSNREIMETFYLMILSRYPTEDELKTIADYARSGELGRRELAADLAWSLINSAEFLYRH